MNSAYSDHSQAASVPTEISVSIVAAPCLRLAQAALWNGQAAHSTTGVTRFSDSHWKLSNCSAGTIASSSAGTDSSAATIRRRRSGAVSSSSRVSGSAVSGSAAPYPTASTASTSCSGATVPGSNSTRARSVA
jgi:hypothetical protein